MGSHLFNQKLLIGPKQQSLLPAPGKPHPIQVAEPQTGGEGYRVLLFNDNVHTMDQVILQVRKALDCATDVAVAIMARAHNRGRSVVTIAERGEAERVAGVLREIALSVAVDRL